MAENFFGITDTGRVRQNNEDAFIAQRVLNDQYIMACVIDGVGGYEGGEVAAAIAKQSILDYFKIPSGDMITMMKEAFISANKKIQQEKFANTQLESMACVVTLAIIDEKNKQFFYAHVGDTRLYLLRDYSLVKLTKDHSFVGYLEDNGRLSEEAAMSHPKRNEINKALGFGGSDIGISTDYIETGQSPFLPGDMLLLCSDGLTDLVSNREINTILTANHSLEEKCQLLVNAANERGGKDNITVVIVHNSAKPLRQKATKPVASKKHESDATEKALEQKQDVRSAQKRKSRKTLSIILLLASALLMAFVVWQFFGEEDEQIIPASSNISLQSSPFMLLSDSLQFLQSDTLVISDSVYAQPLTITDTLTIDRDTLHLIGKGNVVLKSHSAFIGAGILLGSNCKYVLLENIVLEGFMIGVAAQTDALHLKNVRFKNCAVPVQHQMIMADSLPVSGSFKKGFGIDTSKQTLRTK